jgi:integrase/recombinase XerD
MMDDYYQKSMRALQLAGMSQRTQECYTRSVRMLVDFYGKAPDLIEELQLQDYFLHRKNVDKWSPATMRICYSGIKFFFVNVLKRDWHTLQLIHAQRERRLPTVLSVKEVHDILNTVNTPQNEAYLTTVYSCGLRLQEGLNLQVSDIDSERMRIHVHRGKGLKTVTCRCPSRHWIS